MKGLFITFEGLDGSGKSTQLKNIARVLREEGFETVESREPGGTEFAEKIRSLVLDASLPITPTTQSLLYFAARSEHVDKLLRPSKEAGKIVLCDRFSDSTLVYQGLAEGKAVEELWDLRQINSYATENFVPDLTLVFDGRPEKLIERRMLRGVSDRYEDMGLDFQHKLRSGFLALAKLEPHRIKVINAEGTLEEVQREALAVIREVIAKETQDVG
ncbi:MAG: dTMP kinase [Phascolarctobacterium sp.]|nr:dTMP kinase [Phascolarctobacterium sp.]